MANTGVIHGGDIMLYVNTGTEGTPTWTPGAHATEHSISHSMAPREISSKDTGKYAKIKPGKHGVSTISVNALRSYDGYSYFDWKALFDADTRIGFKLSGRLVSEEIAEVAEAAGDEYEKGYGYITALDCANPHDSNSTMSMTISIDGETTTETVSA